MIIENQRLPKISEDLPKIAEVEIFLKTIYRGYVVLQSNGQQANRRKGMTIISSRHSGIIQSDLIPELVWPYTSLKFIGFFNYPLQITQQSEAV